MLFNTRGNGQQKTGKLVFVDLAGSERVAVIALDAKLYEEALFINESLKYLGYIVKWLASGKEHAEVNFYLNDMTAMVRDSLGGNAQSMFFFCISPSIFDVEATNDTLMFA
jgi:kinesin family protein 5